MAVFTNPRNAIVATMQRVQSELPEDLTGAAISKQLQAWTASPTVESTRRCAEFLRTLGFVSQSAKIYEALATYFPDAPAGLVGLAQIAMHRKEWNVALMRWSSLISSFPQQNNSYWLSARARTLDELGRATDNTDITCEAIGIVAQQPFALIDRAQDAMRRCHWAEAVELWDEVLAAVTEQHPRIQHWHTARATSLLELARHAEAEADLYRVFRADPWMITALQAIMRIQCITGRHAQAARELRASAFGDAELPTLFPIKMQLLRALCQFDEARNSFALMLRYAVGLEILELLFDEAPRLHEGWPLTQIWIELMRRLNQIHPPPTAEEATSIDILRARIQLALRDYSGFLQTSSRIGTRESKRTHVPDLVSVAGALQDSRFPDFYKQKVFGIGLSRTGTTTLAAALCTLGLNALHWTNPLTGELIGEADLHLFDAFTDLPFCTSFEKQFQTFPNAKFIYTTRPIESWLGSFTAHWQKVHDLDGFDQIKHAFASKSEFHYGMHFRDIHFQLFFRHASAVEAYMSYDERVRDFFRGERRERFLEFSVFNGDDWTKLCQFLGKEIPDVPFPFENCRSPILS